MCHLVSTYYLVAMTVVIGLDTATVTWMLFDETAVETVKLL